MNPSQTKRSNETFRKVRLFAALMLLSALAKSIYGQLPAGYDQRPRVDTAGNIVDAHDGMLAQFGNTYYLYGTAYGKTSGLEYIPYTNYFQCYTSTDLVTWTLAASHLLKTNAGNNVFLDPPRGTYYLPKVIYNTSSNYYVMWYNWWTQLEVGSPYLGVAISTNPLGPFSIKNHTAVVGAHDLSVIAVNDPQSPYNQNAYMEYTAYTLGFKNFVQQLTPDYLTLTNGYGSGVLVASGGEGTALFYNSNYHKFYCLLGIGTCFFCPTGQVADVYECTNPPNTGPWPFANKINNVGSGGVPIIPGQQTHVAQIGTNFLWMADVWGAGPSWGLIPPLDDRGEDQQYWGSLHFDTNGHIAELSGAYSPQVVLMNKSTLTWYEDAQLMAYPSDGSAPITVGTLSGANALPWYPNNLWTNSLSALSNQQYYALELQDLHNSTAYLVPNQDYINSSSLDAGLDPWRFDNRCGSISGYVSNHGTGGYFGWITTWSGQPGYSAATLTLTNSGLDCSDPLQVVAYLNSNSTPIVVAVRSNYWYAGQTWTMSLSTLTAGYPYSFAVQDVAYNNALIPPVSYLMQVPASGAVPSGYLYYTGTGGYFGWYTSWGWPPATLTLTNLASASFPYASTVVAQAVDIHYNNLGSPVVVGQISANWAPQQAWTMPLTGLTNGTRYLFQLQTNGVSVFPGSYPSLQLPSGALLTGGIYNDGGNWFSQWNWEWFTREH